MSKGLGKSILELSRDSIRVVKEMSSLSEEKNNPVQMGEED
jgi:hypothetical protein